MIYKSNNTYSSCIIVLSEIFHCWELILQTTTASGFCQKGVGYVAMSNYQTHQKEQRRRRKALLITVSNYSVQAVVHTIQREHAHHTSLLQYHQSSLQKHINAAVPKGKLIPLPNNLKFYLTILSRNVFVESKQ